MQGQKIIDSNLVKLNELIKEVNIFNANRHGYNDILYKFKYEISYICYFGHLIDTPTHDVKFDALKIITNCSGTYEDVVLETYKELEDNASDIKVSLSDLIKAIKRSKMDLDGSDVTTLLTAMNYILNRSIAVNYNNEDLMSHSSGEFSVIITDEFKECYNENYIQTLMKEVVKIMIKYVKKDINLNKDTLAKQLYEVIREKNSLSSWHVCHDVSRWGEVNILHDASEVLYNTYCKLNTINETNGKDSILTYIIESYPLDVSKDQQQLELSFIFNGDNENIDYGLVNVLIRDNVNNVDIYKVSVNKLFNNIYLRDIESDWNLRYIIFYLLETIVNEMIKGNKDINLFINRGKEINKIHSSDMYANMIKLVCDILDNKEVLDSTSETQEPHYGVFIG